VASPAGDWLAVVSRPGIMPAGQELDATAQALTGQMLCKSCQPRPERECAYCGHRRKVTVVWRDGPACASCYRAAMRAKADCPGCGQHRRGSMQNLCAGCAGVPPGPACGDCGNEDWLYHKGRCARCVPKTRLASLLGSEPERTPGAAASA
jgi:hypothetical protein